MILCFGLVALYLLFRVPSDLQNSWLFGFSRERLLIGGGLSIILMCLGMLILISHLQPVWWKEVVKRTREYISQKGNLFWLFTLLYSLFISISVPSSIAVFTPALRNLALFQAVEERYGALILWIILTLILLGIIFYTSFFESISEKRVFTRVNLSFWILPLLVIYFLSIHVTNEYSLRNPNQHFEYSLVLSGIFFLTWGLLNLAFDKQKLMLEKINQIFLEISVFIVTYLIYEQYAYLLDWLKTPRKAYWHLLAREFLNGRLFLISQSELYGELHDLIYYFGRWYVPPPPLPAILMVPYVLLARVENVNTVWFSIIFSSFNSLMVYLILDHLRKREWIKLPRLELLWLVALFAFGTPHFWVGMGGMMVLVSQILSVTFVAGAILCVLKGRSPWLVGGLLGLGIASRPSLFVIWPLLLTIAIQVLREQGHHLGWKWLLKWMIKSALPILFVGIGLLVYNYLRFDDALNFGYTMVNSSQEIIENSQNFGVFDVHFIPTNLFHMFLKIPSLRLSSPYIFPSFAGMSMLATTPALVFLIHRYEKKWWIIGAWTSVIMSIGVLSLYHNTGSAQFGYRYILDFIIPLFMLLAYALGNKCSRLFHVTVIISIAINCFGAWWFITFL